MKKDVRTYVYTIVSGIVLIFAIAYIGLKENHGHDLYEYITYRMHPSAEIAYRNAEAHFNPKDPEHYNLNRAEYFYQEAERQGSTEPYLNHQLARIAFLNGHFGTALMYINKQIALHATSTPNSYYMRGLIEGYQGNYTDAVYDYNTYLTYDPANWAAINDEAWVLLKARRFTEASQVLARGLSIFPRNPWLFNSYATALYELGDYTNAHIAIHLAHTYVSKLTEDEWATAYPGNDPAVASIGLNTFKNAVENNMHRIDTTATTTIKTSI